METMERRTIKMAANREESIEVKDTLDGVKVCG